MIWSHTCSRVWGLVLFGDKFEKGLDKCEDQELGCCLMGSGEHQGAEVCREQGTLMVPETSPIWWWAGLVGT